MSEKDNNQNLPEELVTCLKHIVKKLEEEDGFIRKQQIKIWKKNDEFWHGIQYIFWSESKQDWLVPTDFNLYNKEEGREDVDGPFYDFALNIYKAHGESIISALGAQIPAVRFPPDDADNDDDLTTSKVYNKIVDLIQRHNRAKLVLLQALLMLWNQGIVAAYHRSKQDPAYGSVPVPKYSDGLSCPKCDTVSTPEEGADVEEGTLCPECQQPMKTSPVLTGFEDSPKSRTLIDIYGGLNVKISYFARRQKELGYLFFYLDQSRAYLKDLYPWVADKILDRRTGDELYERMARTPSSYSAYSTTDENRDLLTHKRCWIMPWEFEILGKDEQSKKRKLQKLFPSGCRVTFVGDTYVESVDEDFNKYWTVGKAGLSQYIHSDALGQPLIPVQEMTNVLANLTLETIEHGIPSSYADPKVLNFEAYSKHENRPGMVYPAKPVAGKSLSDAFFESGRATLSKEVEGFGDRLEQTGQFVVGSFPSLYGGPGEGNSRTASEYSQSRQMALQRLMIASSLLSFWWAELMEKCVHCYVENLIDDEHYVTMQNNNYVNVWIRRAELTGKVGEVEAEGSETFPVSTPQKQAMLMKLIEMQNEYLNTAIFSPENRKLVGDALSFPEFQIPGEDQRIKQARETQMMLNTGQPVEINPVVDDHDIHATDLRHFLAENGLDIERTNPQAYQLLMQHLQQHILAMAPVPTVAGPDAAPQGAVAPGAVNGNGGPPSA